MKKRFVILMCLLFGVILIGCSSGTDPEKEVAQAVDEPAQAVEETTQAVDESAKTVDEVAQTEDESVQAVDEIEKTEDAVGEKESESLLTDEQALFAIKNYCYAENPDLKGMEESGDYTIYWDVLSVDEKEVVVLYRSYTGAEIRYYIDRISGDTYVKEFVPGITEEEERTEESFNVKDYISGKSESSDIESGEGSDGRTIMNDGGGTFYDAMDAFNGEYPYSDSSDGQSGTLKIIQELDNSREYSIFDGNDNGYRFIALGSNVEYIKGNRMYMKYPEMVYDDGSAVFKYYIIEKQEDHCVLYETDENYENPKQIY